jgi:hypothetical protein
MEFHKNVDINIPLFQYSFFINVIKRKDITKLQSVLENYDYDKNHKCEANCRKGKKLACC